MISLTHAISFDYDNKPRVVEVHAHGQSAKGEIIRAWQIAGESSRPLPCWALFSVDKMINVTLTNIPSEAPRPGYVMNDSAMTTIYAQIRFPEFSVRSWADGGYECHEITSSLAEAEATAREIFKTNPEISLLKIDDYLNQAWYIVRGCPVLIGPCPTESPA